MQSVLYVIGALGSKDTSAKVNIKSRTAIFLPLPRCISINILSCVSACQTAVHKKCHDKLLTKCPESGKQSENTIVSICSSSILQFLFHVQFEFQRVKFFLQDIVTMVYNLSNFSFNENRDLCFLVQVCTKECRTRINCVCLFIQNDV